MATISAIAPSVHVLHTPSPSLDCPEFFARSRCAVRVEHVVSRWRLSTPRSRTSSDGRFYQIRCAAAEDGEASASDDGANLSDATGNVPEAGVGVRDGADARPRKRSGTRVADSTDWISSSLTRRFGLGAGFAWVGVLAFGVISEQVKTRNEVFREEQGTRDLQESKEVSLPNGIRYSELREGGGSIPQRGDLVLISLVGKVADTGEVFVDTTAKGKRPVAFLFGAKPYSGGMCDGLEYVLQTMKVGAKRRIIVPPAFGFGERGTILNSGAKIPGNAMLEYVVELQKASIAPS